MPGEELRGRTAIVSGASQGLGQAIAAAYLREGASVVLCARNEPELAESVAMLARLPDAAGRVIGEPADVARRADVERLVKRTLGEFGELHILVNNAAIHGPKGALDEIDFAAWADAISINLLGSASLAHAVLPHMKARRYGKIIQISGGGATKPMPRLSAYAASKAAVVRLAETLAQELQPYGIDVNCMAPGALNTRLLDDVLQAGPERVGGPAFEAAKRQQAEGGVALDVPARLAVFLASSRSDGITGKLISAVWDDWEAFPGHLRELAGSDVYTLRRIVAKDRGFDWGDK